MKTYFGSEFSIDKFSALDGKTTVTYTQNRKTTGEPFVLRANAQGITISGSLEGILSTRKELEGLAELIADAWKSHLTLVPKIETSFSGH